MRSAVRVFATKQKQARRWFKVNEYHEVSYKGNGDPAELLTFKEDRTISENGPPEPGFVKVNMLHVPWNPADVNSVQGTYPSPYGSQKNSVRPSAKSQLLDEALIAGSEGWGRVASSNGSHLKEGSLVAIGRPGL
eukprot:scaffold20053_cov117-Cylindrotheca_fusiformis.AAC.6